MKSFLLALQFLTIVPVSIKKINPEQMSRSVIYFPVVGLLLGSILAGVNYFLNAFGFGGISSNIILVVLLVILTGGLHLDGLSDTSDALFSGKSKDAMLAIMRDPHVGAIGVLAIISAVLLKIAFLSAIGPALKVKALILMCVMSRWSMPLSIYSFPYARQDGKAKAFVDGMNIWIFLAVTLVTITIAYFLLNISGILILGVIGACAYLTAGCVKNKVGGITGDTIGAIGEIMEIAVLISFVILQRIAV